VASFTYSAIRNDGTQVTGSIEAADRETAIRRLGEQGQHPIEVNEAGSEVSARSIFALGGGAASFADISIFTRELAWLLRAGMSLSNALAMLAKESFSPQFSRLVDGLRTDIRKGKSFHEALANSGAFGGYYVSMVEVGEASGTLPAVLERISLAREREQKTRSKLASALVYPSLLLTLAIGAVSFILVQVVPSIKDMITGSGAPVPAAAQFVIGLSDWLIANGQTVLVGVPAAGLAVILLFGAGGLRRGLLRVASHLPLIGGILRKSAVVQFCRLLGTLLAAGVNLPESLRLMRPSLADQDMRKAVEGMEQALREGGDFLAPLEHSRSFPKLFSRMLRVGNETGNLTPSVLQVTTILEEELDRTVERSLTLLEPLIILSLSAVVASIIMSLMSAIISINDLAL
jgi:general secretion pathway protein F